MEGVSKFTKQATIRSARIQKSSTAASFCVAFSIIIAQKNVRSSYVSMVLPILQEDDEKSYQHDLQV